MDADRPPTMRDYGGVVLRRKWIVIAAVATALIGAWAMSLLQDPIYRAEAQMLVEPRSGEAVFQEDPALNVQNLERSIQTEIKVLEGQQVRERVQQDLGLEELPPEVNATPAGSTDVVSVTVRSKDPRTAQVLADAYVEAYSATRREQAINSLEAARAELQNTVDDLQEQIAVADDGERPGLIAQRATFKERLDQLQVDAALTTGGASVVKPADLPDEPVEPQPLRTAALAGVVGLLLGLGAAFLIDHLDDSVRTAEDVQSLTAVPVLAVVPVEPPPDNRPIALSEPHEFAVEIFRGLRTSVQFLGLDRPLRTIQVTSSLPAEGKTTTVSNLAIVLAQAGHQVLVLDADLRKPMLHEMFSTPAAPGFTEMLLGETLDAAVNHVEPGLDVIPAGAVPLYPSEMLSSGRVGALIEDLSKRYDYVLIDSAPILPVADAVALSRAVEGVLLVAQANRTSKRDIEEGLDRLEQVGARLIGVVLNRAQAGGREVGYGYGYGYAYGGRRADEGEKVGGEKLGQPLPPPWAPPQGPAVTGEPR